jgi:hypothetical protein
MKEITIEEFNKLPKKATSSRQLEVGKLYYIRDSRNKQNPVYIGRYLQPVTYYNDNSTLYNYRFEDVKYLVNPSKYKQNPSTIFGNIPQYFEVLDPIPTKMDIKNKKDTLTELSEFIRVKKAEPHDSTPTISFMGKDYRKVRDKYNNNTSKQRSSLSSSRSRSSSKKRTKRRSSSSKSSRSSRKTRSSRSSSRPSSRSSYGSYGSYGSY